MHVWLRCHSTHNTNALLLSTVVSNYTCWAKLSCHSLRSSKFYFLIILREHSLFSLLETQTWTSVNDDTKRNILVFAFRNVTSVAMNNGFGTKSSEFVRNIWEWLFKYENKTTRLTLIHKEIRRNFQTFVELSSFCWRPVPVHLRSSAVIRI